MLVGDLLLKRQVKEREELLDTINNHTIDAFHVSNIDTYKDLQIANLHDISTVSLANIDFSYKRLFI